MPVVNFVQIMRTKFVAPATSFMVWTTLKLVPKEPATAQRLSTIAHGNSIRRPFYMAKPSGVNEVLKMMLDGGVLAANF